MTAARNVTANFDRIIYSLIVTKLGTGNGTVTSSVAGISCGTDCMENYVPGDSVTLTAVAATGSTFAGWSGACTGTGTCTVSMTAAKSVIASFAQNKINQTITFTAVPSLSVGSIGTISATGGNSGNAITFDSNTPLVCAVSGSTVTGVSAGTCTVTADQAGNDNYNAAAQATQTITVGKSNQAIGAITFNPTTLTVGGTTTANATATSGLPVNFSSTTPGICTVSGGTVTGIVAGICTVAANQAGNASYSAAPQVTNNITVVANITKPAAPSIASAVPGNAQVTLNWSAVNGAASYSIFMGINSGGEAPKLSGVTGTNATITGLVNGVKYYFKIKAINTAGTSTYSNEVNATPAAPPPTPTLTSVVAGVGQVVLRWSSVATATSYNIYQGTISGGEALVISGLTGTTRTITGLTNGTTYFFTVTAVTNGGVSAFSNELSATPQAALLAPAINSATPGNAAVTLKWSTVTGATSYNIFWGTVAGGENQTRTGVIGKAVAITGLVNGTTYFFKMKAVNASGTSPFSNEVSATPNTPPSAPVINTAVPGDMQVTLNWTSVTGATSYNVYDGVSSGGEFPTPILTGLTGNSVVVTGLTNGVPYFFKMRAVNTGGASGLSNELSTTPGPTPRAPTVRSVTPGNSQVTVKWTAVANAISYNIYWGTSAGGENLQKTALTGTSAVITGLTNGTTYFFTMKAVNASGTSTVSNEASATPIAPPTAPVLNSAIPGNSQVTLTWSTVSGADSYNVYRGTTHGGERLVSEKITGTSKTDTGLTSGMTYYFKVRAVNAGGVSAFSNELSVTPQ
ncbi:hypothetical protein CCP3SC15_70046 [Gammaproteobacteria bacterium]